MLYHVTVISLPSRMTVCGHLLIALFYRKMRTNVDAYFFCNILQRVFITEWDDCSECLE